MGATSSTDGVGEEGAYGTDGEGEMYMIPSLSTRRGGIEGVEGLACSASIPYLW